MNRKQYTIEVGNEKCQGKPAAPISLTGRKFYPIVRSDSNSFIPWIRLVGKQGWGRRDPEAFNILVYETRPGQRRP